MKKIAADVVRTFRSADTAKACTTAVFSQTFGAQISYQPFYVEQIMKLAVSLVEVQH